MSDELCFTVVQLEALVAQGFFEFLHDEDAGGLVVADEGDVVTVDDPVHVYVELDYILDGVFQLDCPRVRTDLQSLWYANSVRHILNTTKADINVETHFIKYFALHM